MELNKELYPLKPCPFCGGEAYSDVCDRLINIGCKNCDYHLHFGGLLRSKCRYPELSKTHPSVSELEFYYKDAHEDAVKKWNTRMEDNK